MAKKVTLERKRCGFQNLLLIVIIAISLTSCLDKQIDGVSSPNPNTDSTSFDTTLTLDDYKVLLAADADIYMHETCELRVWIGAESVTVSFSTNMVKDSTTIPARIGQYAKITPYAPDFEISPKEMSCIRIDPSGSDVRFLLKPKKSGQLKVSANIALFNNAECTGPPVPKLAKTLAVDVKINKTYLFTSEAKKMIIILWDKFLSFWGLLITLLFSTLLFLIRRKIKGKTGFDDKHQGE